MTKMPVIMTPVIEPEPSKASDDGEGVGVGAEVWAEDSVPGLDVMDINVLWDESFSCHDAVGPSSPDIVVCTVCPHDVRAQPKPGREVAPSRDEYRNSLGVGWRFKRD
jgi:hypothetical protein